LKTTKQSIVIIGAGNVATSLALALHQKKYPVLQILSKSRKSAAVLAKKVNASNTHQLSAINTAADLYFICVNDNSIEQVITEIAFLKNKLLVHTSGSVNSNVLKSKGNSSGVFYPLQSFTKAQPKSFNQLTLFLEASNVKAKQQLNKIAQDLKCEVYFASSSKRLKIHMAAVFANNFVNHCYHIAYQILKKENIPFEILEATIIETTQKLKIGTPYKNQTGPAKRNDTKTLNTQLQLLETNKDWQQVYKALTQSIVNTYNKKL
jgi:predicted short-subunit dehydrogenase-like oxidoreductase (DUF2520 family)